ncbi:MAG: translocation/assembly module TamB domain-containing protein [bacterium]
MHSKKKKLLWVKHVLLISIALIALLLFGAFAFRQQIGRYLLKRTVAALGRAIDASVSYRTIEGDIFSHPRITGLHLIAKTESIFINKLEVSYDLLSLLRRKIVLLQVKVIEPDVRITRLTARIAGREEKTKLRFPNLTARRLELVNGRVWFGGVLRIDSIMLNLSLNAAGSRLELGVDSGFFSLVSESIQVRTIHAQMAIQNDFLVLKDFVARTKSSGLEGQLTVDLLNGAITVDSARLLVDLPEMLNVPGSVWLSGKARLGKKQKGISADWRAENLTFQKLKLPGLTGGFNLTDSILNLTLSGGNLELGDLTVKARLNLSDFLFSTSILLTDVPINKFGQDLPEFSLTALLNASGRLGSLARMLRMEDRTIMGDSVNIYLYGRTEELGVDTIFAAINYYGKRFELRELMLAGPAGNFHFDGLAKADRLVARCKMAGFDLRVAGKFLSIPLTGRADGSLLIAFAGDSWMFNGLVRVLGFGTTGAEVTNGLIQVDLTGKPSSRAGPQASGSKGLIDRANTLAQTQVFGRLAVGGEGVKIAGQEWNWAQFVWTGPEFDLRFEQDSLRLVVLGDINFEKSGVTALVRTLSLVVFGESLGLTDSCYLTFQGDSINIQGVRVNLADGEVKFNGIFVPASLPKISLQAKNLNLRKIARLTGMKIDLWGTADLDVAGRETLSVSLTANDLELSTAGIYFKHLAGDFKLTRETALLNYLKFVARTDTSTITGSIEYELQPELKLTGMDLRLDLSDPGVWLFGVTKPYVEILQGIVYAQAGVRWQPDNLVLSGRARLTDGELTVPSVQAKVARVDGELTFRGNRIIIEKLSGRTAKGILTAEGFAQLNENWQCESLRYQTHFTGVSAIPIPQVLALGNGDITVSWRQSELALISGAVQIDEALATIGFGGQSTGGNSAAGVNYDIHIRGERGIWLRNRDADIELGVNLTTRHVGDETVYFGEMVSHQGAVYYLDHTLRVTEGKLIFDNVSGFNPQLDLTAEMPVSGKRDNAPEKIVLKLTGTLQEPSFVFQSEPPVWDETQIITYLSLNVTMDELSVLEQKELISRLLSERLLSYFQTQVSKRVRDFISLDYLEFETGLVGAEAAKVTVGKYIGRNLYLSYTQNFTEELQPAFRMEYYLNRRNELIAERSAQGRYSFRYRFKLRF